MDFWSVRARTTPRIAGGSNTGAKARSSNAQKGDRGRSFSPRNDCRFCSMLRVAALPKVTLNQRVHGSSP